METVAFATVAAGAIVAIIWKPEKRSRRSILFTTVATVATGAIIWKPGLRTRETEKSPKFKDMLRTYRG